MALTNSFEDKNIPTVGYFPPSFPRDPVDVNVYLEHVMLGQALDPLFTLAQDGTIKGAVADKWEFKDEHKQLVIYLKKNLVFSNGQKLKAQDVKYSIDRHLSNEVSQSYNYLKVIKSIKIIDDYKILIELHNKYVPILFALSRDQLGILPNKWVFDKDATEPFIGTGPYRIIREKNQWYFIKNEKSIFVSDIKISKWKVIILDPATEQLPTLNLDLGLLLLPSVFNNIKNKTIDFEKSHYFTKPFSSFQLSYWWLKNNFSKFNFEEKYRIKVALDFIRQQYVLTNGGELSTGVIPKGIMGSLNETPAISMETLKSKKISLSLYIPASTKDFFEVILKSNEFKKSNVDIKISVYNVKEIKKIKESNCDMALFSYAGGFFDPEGFLSVLSNMIGNSTDILFGLKANAIRVKAGEEFDSAKRSSLYREFSRISQQEIRYVPGWAPQYFEIRSKFLTKKESAFNYSYKLMDYAGKEDSWK